MKLGPGTYKFINGQPVKVGGTAKTNQPKETKAARKLASKQRRQSRR